MVVKQLGNIKWGYYNFLIPVGCRWYLRMYFILIPFWSNKELSYLGKVPSYQYGNRNLLTQMINWVNKDSLILWYLIKYQYWTKLVVEFTVNYTIMGPIPRLQQWPTCWPLPSVTIWHLAVICSILSSSCMLKHRTIIPSNPMYYCKCHTSKSYSLEKWLMLTIGGHDISRLVGISVTLCK